MKDKKEVEYKEKAGTAWSHSYLNQKPWHPLSYPNQRRKWIAEQTHAQKEGRRAEVAREFAQEQAFFRQTAQMSKKEKEKMEVMQAVSFMYMRPPGYNAEAARAAEIADERKKLGLTTTADVDETPDDGKTGTSLPKPKNPRVKDVFGRTLPTEEEFPSLRNAPRHDTGAPTRVKPFAIEIRNVKCARCGAFGHQSGDRECPLKDMLMPSEQARLIREDPLSAILAQTAADELSTWELKQKPGGLSPARGGFKSDDPNQQIIPNEDIYDEYGGFLPGGGGDEGTMSIPNLLASLSHEQRKELTDVNVEKQRTHKKQRKVRRKDKRLESGESANSGDHNPGRDEQRDGIKSNSSEGEQRFQKPRKEEPNSSKDDNKIRLYGDGGKSHSSGDERGSQKGTGRKGFSFHWSNKKCHRSKGRRTLDKTDDSTKDRIDMNVEYQIGTRQKNIHREGDARMDSGKEPYRLRYKNGRDAIDSEERRLRFKDRRESSAHVEGKLVYRNSSNDEPWRVGYKNKMDSTHDKQRRLRQKNCRDSNDFEQRRPSHKNWSHTSDDDQKKLRHKCRRDSIDDGQKRLRHKGRRDSTDNEQKRLRHKYRRDSIDNAQKRLRHKERRDSTDNEQKRLRHKYRRDSTDNAQKRLRHTDRKDSSDHEPKRLKDKDTRESSDDEQKRLRHNCRRDNSGDEQKRLGHNYTSDSSDDEQKRFRQVWER